MDIDVTGWPHNEACSKFNEPCPVGFCSEPSIETSPEREPLSGQSVRVKRRTSAVDKCFHFACTESGLEGVNSQFRSVVFPSKLISPGPLSLRNPFCTRAFEGPASTVARNVFHLL